jgi:hypothetical protein
MNPSPARHVPRPLCLIPYSPVDEIWVLPSSASNAPTTNKHINPNLIALVGEIADLVFVQTGD